MTKSLLDGLMLSSSGWRKIFKNQLPASQSSLETFSIRASGTASLPLSTMVASPFKFALMDIRLIVLAAEVFATYFKSRLSKKTEQILIARDSRLSGEALAAIIQTVFQCKKGMAFTYIGVTSLPEALACVKLEPSLKGCLYLTASHNPKEYNGFKLGDARGKVLASSSARSLIKDLLIQVTAAVSDEYTVLDAFIKQHQLCNSYVPQALSSTRAETKTRKQTSASNRSSTNACAPGMLAGSTETLPYPLYSNNWNQTWRRRAALHYKTLAQALALPDIKPLHRTYTRGSIGNNKVSTRKGLSTSKRYENQLHAHSQLLHLALKTLPRAVTQAQTALLIHYNGSARVLASEQNLFASWGLTIRTLGASAGAFRDSIVPEGPALRTLKHALTKYKQARKTEGLPPPLLGLQVDADGDRGNLVIFPPKTRYAQALAAQLTFALSVLSRLALLKAYFPMLKPAVVANGATSLIIRDLVAASGGLYIQSETGEANVLAAVELAEQKGYYVALAGEGSNGGNILPPATVRDPLAFILSLLQLLFLPAPNTPSPRTSKRSTTRAKLEVTAELTSSPLEAAAIILQNLAKNQHAQSQRHTTTQTRSAPTSKLVLAERLGPAPFEPELFSHQRPEVLFYRMLEQLKRYVTTSVVDPKTLLQLPHAKGGAGFKLKQAYASALTKHFNSHKRLFRSEYGIYRLSFALHLGARTRVFMEARAIPHSPATLKGGGLSTYLHNRAGAIIGFLWFRVSQTEPVLRTLVEFSRVHVAEHGRTTPDALPRFTHTTYEQDTKKHVKTLLTLHHRILAEVTSNTVAVPTTKITAKKPEKNKKIKKTTEPNLHALS